MGSALAVFVVVAPPVGGLVAALGGAVEPLVATPQAVEATSEGGIAVVDVAVLQHEGAHAGPLARISRRVGAGHLGADIGAAAFGRRVGSRALVIIFSAAFSLLLLGQRHGEIPVEVAVERGGPGEGPAHAPLERLQLFDRRAIHRAWQSYESASLSSPWWQW